MASRASSSQRLEPLRHVDAGVLNIAYYEAGPADGPVAILLHGFPYDIHSYVDVAPLLAEKDCRVIVPYVRGYGPTRFLDAKTPRSGQQAAIGADLIALMDALSIKRAVFGGYDWGGRGACIGAALWPERCIGLASVNGYLVQDIARALNPARLSQDFVDVAIHSYRHRYGLAGGDPRYADLERRLAALPPITVPAITLDGDADGVTFASDGTAQAARFTGKRVHRVIHRVGHNLPQEDPEAFAAAVMELVGG